MAIQSSPLLKEHPLIKTSVQDSGSQPSLLGPIPSVATLLKVTFLHKTGFKNHIEEFLNVTPSTRIFLHLYGWKKTGLRNDPSPNTRSLTGTFFSPISTNLSLACFWLNSPLDAFHFHQFSLLPCPSKIPSPVTAIFC